METNRRIDIDRDKLGAAFKALRKLGFIARQNYLCCGNCAGCQIAIDIDKMPEEKKAKVQGAVFYHRQAREAMDDGHGLWLNYGPVSASGKEYGLPTEQVGALALVTLREAGLLVEWDGNPATRLFVSGTVA